MAMNCTEYLETDVDFENSIERNSMDNVFVIVGSLPFGFAC